MSERVDVLVAGAGPGGSAAARALAAGGARVLLVDRAVFPRDKPCGGGVLLSALPHLPFALDAVAERTVTAFRVTYRRGGAFTQQYGAPLAIMTQRRLLDAFLVEQAVAAGAVFRDGVAVQAVEINGGVSVRFASGEVVTAAAAVAADGANGVCRRALGLGPLRRAVALEGNVAGVPDRWSEAVSLDLGSLPGGYGWVFPKGDHCNVGVGAWPSAGPTLRNELAAYARSEGLDAAALWGLRGHTLPLRDPGSRAVAGPVAFVGDAAGVIDPLSGEGIGNAIRTGALAAREIARYLEGAVTDLAGYQGALEREIEPDLAVARQLYALFHQRPWPYVQAFHRSGRFWRAFCRVIRGEGTYTGFKARLGPSARLVDLAAWQAARGLHRRNVWDGPGQGR